MAVGLVGGISKVRSTTATTGVPTWTQTPTAGNWLIALLSWGGTTASTTASVQHTGTSGWSNLLADIRDGGNLAGVSVWSKVAAGGDAAPSFDLGVAGTLACNLDIYELSGADSSALDTSGSFLGGNGVTLTAISATTSGNVVTANGYGFFIAARERTAVTSTITPGASWTQDDEDGATSSVFHFSSQRIAAPATGATLTGTVNYSGTGTTSHGAAYVLVVKPSIALIPPELVMPGMTGV